MSHDVWVEVDLAALRHNFQQVRSALDDEVRIMAVVKANGYGHGYAEPAKAFVEAGADALAVTRIEEALELRSARIDAPILLLAPVQPDNAEAAVEANLDITTTSLQMAETLSEAARRVGKPASVHLKFDTGMGRLGTLPWEAADFAQTVSEMPWIKISGAFTHFATASDRDIRGAKAQLRRFEIVLNELDQRGIDYGAAHAANSAAMLRMPRSHLDMVRPGTVLFGQYPSRHVPQSLSLVSAWRLKVRVCQVRELPAGAAVGYGAEFRTKRATRTAILPIGWADGFTLVPQGPMYRQGILTFALRRRNRSLWAQVRGQRVPVIGRVAMQTTVLDVTRVRGVEVGDEVSIPAMRIPVSSLVPRVYVD